MVVVNFDFLLIKVYMIFNSVFVYVKFLFVVGIIFFFRFIENVVSVVSCCVFKLCFYLLKEKYVFSILYELKIIYNYLLYYILVIKILYILFLK